MIDRSIGNLTTLGCPVLTPLSVGRDFVPSGQEVSESATRAFFDSERLTIFLIPAENVSLIQILCIAAGSL